MTPSQALATQLERFLDGIERMRECMDDALARGDTGKAEEWRRAIEGSFTAIDRWRQSNAHLFR